jgi:DMSO/TMAO reductase YedYZ molybdopterin-dependent catalytic subunit
LLLAHVVGAVSLGLLPAAGIAQSTGDLPAPPPAPSLARGPDGALAGAQRAPGSLAPFITSNDAFYTVTKNAAGDPSLDAEQWRLIVDGEVAQPVQLDYRLLRQLPTVEVTKTLECISNFTSQCDLASFGCELISTAVWKGVHLADIIGLAGGLNPGVVSFAVIAQDEFSAGLPVDVALDPGTLVVYEMNGEVLPRAHGFPARLLTPGRYGMKNPKWLAAIRPMTNDYLGWYEQRNWNKDGIVQTMARIDVPAGGDLTAGPQQLAGIAYAGARGIQAVDVTFDGGQSWDPVELIDNSGGDAWVRWQSSFQLDQGAELTIQVRATDGTGVPQTDTFRLPQPDGATGRNAITVRGSLVTGIEVRSRH